MTVGDLEQFEKLLFAGMRRVSKAKEYLKQLENKSTKKSKHLHFGHVEIREFKPALGGGGVPQEGLPLGLSWDVLKSAKNHVDSFELRREGERIDRQEFMHKGFIPSRDRTRLIRSIGHSKESMEKELMDVWIIKRNRNESILDLSKGYTSDES